METVLSGKGTRARCDGARLLIVRGGTTWTVPVRAIASVERTADSEVTVALSGDPAAAARARHGLGRSVTLSGPNARAADAFAGHLRTACAGVGTAADGHPLVTVRRAPDPAGAGGAGTGESGLRAVLVFFLLLVYAAVLWAVGATGPLRPGPAAASLVVGGGLGILGGVTLWRVGRRFRTVAVLRARGVGVVGRVTGRVRIWAKGSSVWVFPLVSYTTVEGEEFERVPSAVSAGLGAVPLDEAEVLYDPERPHRMGLPPTFGFAVRSLVLGLAGLGSTALFGWAVLANTAVLG
ncbi:hypothetical protein [Streptomyces showdoensis]|uniref:Uncharacterized protein n=1 Tax=Streptomyces showdoensis TaxID=68268 RepID=A0A2P2GT37_STREW|nr:hypothetical protein [Streptomyces showdoensis]KKZ74658.1 hypothetical protein VO63_06100 [Streptomyces showdoensis]